MESFGLNFFCSRSIWRRCVLRVCLLADIRTMKPKSSRDWASSVHSGRVRAGFFVSHFIQAAACDE